MSTQERNRGYERENLTYEEWLADTIRCCEQSGREVSATVKYFLSLDSDVSRYLLRAK